MNGALHGDEIGLIWADLAVSARNLVRGDLNETRENLPIIALEDKRAQWAEIRRRRASRRARFEFEDAEDEREEQSIIAGFDELAEALKRYQAGDDLSHRLIPDCPKAIKAEVTASQAAALKAAAPEIAATKEPMEQLGWKQSGKRFSRGFIAVTHRMALTDLAAKPTVLTPSDCKRNIRESVKRICAPGFDRDSLAITALEFIRATLVDVDSVTALRPSRWYPVHGPLTGGEETARGMVDLALSPHQPLPVSPPREVSFDALRAAMATLPEQPKPDAARARRWRKWNAALKAAEHDCIAYQRLISAGPDPPN